ncbi:MAG: methylmalonyl Co-A mutase-associated GTPase MeaB [Aquabacterium sp.]
MSPEADRVYQDLRQGRPRALSRSISWVENGAPQAAALLEQVYAQAPHPWVIGVTGVGGAGKSSLLPHLARQLAASGHRVAVLAVDPSSPLTGGALLGDRIRDNGGEQPARVFFRSVASRGGQGGLATCVADLVRVAAAGGHDIVVIETVGAGQSELGILQVAHSLLLVAAPGLGDDVQAQKAGVMEVADLLVVNKADRPGADDAMASLRQGLQLSDRSAHLHDGVNQLPDGTQVWHPPVLPTVALAGQGVDAVVACLQDHRAHLSRLGHFEALNRAHDLRRMQTHFQAVLQARLQQRIDALGLRQRLEAPPDADLADPLGLARSLAQAVLPTIASPSPGPAAAACVNPTETTT